MVALGAIGMCVAVILIVAGLATNDPQVFMAGVILAVPSLLGVVIWSKR